MGCQEMSEPGGDPRLIAVNALSGVCGQKCFSPRSQIYGLEIIWQLLSRQPLPTFEASKTPLFQPLCDLHLQSIVFGRYDLRALRPLSISSS